MNTKPATLSNQKGAAILIAMLVVTLVATLAAGLQWRQWRAYTQEAGARTQSQAAWVLVGALDWARLILREDARSNQNASVDHLGEPWALPLQEAKLSSFLSADALVEAGQDEAYLSGQITDAQSKINLSNLTTSANLPAGQIGLDKASFAILYRLYQQLQLPLPELLAWTEAWRLADPALTASSTGSAALRPQHISQLTWLGVPKSSALALTPHLTILPERTTINPNTASALVLFATLPQLDMPKANRLVEFRAQKPFQNLTELEQQMGNSAQLDSNLLAVSSRYFEVRGKLRLGDWVIEESSLVLRSGQDVRTLSRRRE